MRHLTVKNLGPIQEANLELEQINIIIGLQSSGKSCILKTACYCSWIEKRLELAQGANGFDKGSTFLDLMTDYYSMAGYVHEDTYIEYETAHLKFSYDHSARSFKMQWKSGRWKYRRPKVSYVPADRNLVAAIPGWSSLSLDKNMIEFMSNWDKFVADNADLSKCITGTTGGTSGKALKLIIPKNRYSIDRAFTHKQLHKFGWNYNTFAVIRNNKLDDDKDYIINPIMKLVIFDAFRLSEEYARTICKTMKKYHIHCIHAYPSALFQFCKLCKKVDLDLSFIKLCRLTSEQITEEELHFFKHNFNFKLSYSYGHSERLILAGNTPFTDNYLVEENYGYLELVNNDKVIKSTDTLGEMVGTSFNNRYFPLIRYKTGDYTTYCSMGEQRMLGKIQGRWQNSLIYCADGRKISTASLNLHNQIYEKIDGLQYLQEKKGELNILIVKGKTYDDCTEQEILSFYKKCIGNDTVINIKYVDKLTLKPNGKFVLLISNIN